MSSPLIYSPTEPSPIQGWRLLLMGAPGSGKTTVFRTVTTELASRIGVSETQLKLRVLAMDPNVWPVLGDTPAAISPLRASGSWENLAALAKLMKNLDNEGIQKTDFRQKDQDVLMRLIARCTNFIDSKGVNHGCVDTWGTDTVLLIDGTSGLGDIIAIGSLGLKPAWTQPDYQKVMNVIHAFLNQVTRSCFCHVAVIAHVEMEPDTLEVPKIMPSTVGKKLAGKLGRDFTDVVYATMKEGQFSWSTSEARADLKAMHLPFRKDITPGLLPLFNTPEKGWLARGGVISPVVPKEWSEPDYYKV